MLVFNLTNHHNCRHY